jgi:cobalt-precorrin 5A hydrolase
MEHRAMIVVGFGFTTSATADSFAQALEATGYRGPIDRVATPTDKAASTAFVQFATARAVPVAPVAATDLEAVETPARSETSTRHRGTGSVAEAAALAAAGTGATLLIPRQISTDRMATCAVAQGPNP